MTVSTRVVGVRTVGETITEVRDHGGARARLHDEAG
jgi:hypothetical protein